MRKEIITFSIISAMFFAPCLCFADDYAMIDPVIQQIPNTQYSNYQSEYPLPNIQQDTGYQTQQQMTPAVGNGYNTQYPVPVNSYQTQGYNNNSGQLQGNVVFVPANTVFPAISSTPLSSEMLNAGDSVSFYLGSDFYYNGKLVAPAGSHVNGTVLVAKRGGMANRNGKLQIRFSHILTPSGQMIPITASIQTDDGTGVLKAGTAKDAAKEYIKDTAIGAGVGAALGTAMGALSGGKVGRGAIYGTAIGGGMGVISSLMERGGDIDIPQNAQMNIVLDQPVTVTSNTPY
ncbi:hypothetical protein IJ182_01145 [bacterium]|nr:hypothetical protein [bacterium]